MKDTYSIEHNKPIMYDYIIMRLVLLVHKKEKMNTSLNIPVIGLYDPISKAIVILNSSFSCNYTNILMQSYLMIGQARTSIITLPLSQYLDNTIIHILIKYYECIAFVSWARYYTPDQYITFITGQ